MKKYLLLTTGIIVLSAVGFSLKQAGAQQNSMQIKGQQKVELPVHKSAPGDGKNMILQLCDGDTNLKLDGVAPDQKLTSAQAQLASDKLMTMWLAKVDPSTRSAWVKETQQAAQKKTSTKPQPEQYKDFNERDVKSWNRELEREVKYGDDIFHSDSLISSTNGVSCAMCHPHGANTHPETYPKFQIQLRRVALLRDMINWCIENPVRGKKLDPDDPKMRALESYILAQRKGVPLQVGKH